MNFGNCSTRAIGAASKSHHSISSIRRGGVTLMNRATMAATSDLASCKKLQQERSYHHDAPSAARWTIMTSKGSTMTGRNKTNQQHQQKLPFFYSIQQEPYSPGASKQGSNAAFASFHSAALTDSSGYDHSDEHHNNNDGTITMSPPQTYATMSPRPAAVYHHGSDGGTVMMTSTTAAAHEFREDYDVHESHMPATQVSSRCCETGHVFTSSMDDGYWDQQQQQHYPVSFGADTTMGGTSLEDDLD